MMDAYYELAARLQEKERGELTIEENSRFVVELIDRRKKYFGRLKVENIRSKPPIKTQKRNQMCTYLKNMANQKHSQLKNKSFEEIQMLFNNTMKWIESFVSMDTELVKGSEKAAESSSKRAGDKLEQEDATRNFNKEDLEVLWSIVKAKFKKTKLADDMDNLLFQTLKIMFEHHVKDNIWKYQQRLAKVLKWKLFDSCRVYCVTIQNTLYYLLVEKMYPFIRNILHQMWNDVRLQVDYEVEMAYDLLRLINEAVNEEMDDSLERAATTATSLDAEQDRGGGPRCQEAIKDTVAQTRSERVSNISNDPLLAGVNTPQSGEDSLKLNELMELCTNLQQRVLDLETTKTTQALEIDSLKRRVKKLERRRRSRTYRLKRLRKVSLSARVKSSKDEGLGEEDASKQGRISDIDADEGITLVSTHDDAEMFDADKDLHGEEGKAKMIEEPLKLKKKDQIQLDEKVGLKLQAELQAEFEKEQRLANEKAQQEEEANIALIES
nr:hypothetical protein [Tanacetum cinerariifolium]